MAFDLDDDELEATRKMHSDKNVESEEDIKILENYLKNSAYKQSNSDFFKNGGWEIVDLKVPQAIEHILAEREQDKKRIQELEEKLENSIPKQAVIEALEDIEDYFDRLNGPDEDIEYIRHVKQEILEGESK